MNKILLTAGLTLLLGGISAQAQNVQAQPDTQASSAMVPLSTGYWTEWQFSGISTRYKTINGQRWVCQTVTERRTYYQLNPTTGQYLPQNSESRTTPEQCIPQ